MGLINLRVVVKKKPSVLDVEGKTIAKSLNELGFTQVMDCSKGTVIDLVVDQDKLSDIYNGSLENQIKEFVDKCAKSILVNEIIETYSYNIIKPTTDDFIRSFKSLNIKEQGDGFEILKFHANAKNKQATPTELAQSVSQDSFEYANSVYGKFAHKICDFLKYNPPYLKNGLPVWTFVLADWDENSSIWTLREEVYNAVKILDLL
jgi:phosphoribosylformylglycinamidine synthase PurS subunit